MSSPDLNQAAHFRDLVVRVADQPNRENHRLFCDAFASATLFIKLVGVPGSTGAGVRYVVPPGGAIRTRYVRLDNGVEMVHASAVPPRQVAQDEIVATMTGIEVLEMTLKTSAQGIIIAAEDDRNSWSAIKREGFASILNRQNVRLTS